MSWDIAILLVCAVLAALLVTRIIMRPGRKGESPKSVTVHLTGDAFKVVVKGREQVHVRWVDVKTVTVIKTERGPWADVCFYHVAHTNGDLTLPLKAKKMAFWVPKLMTLPGSDGDAFMKSALSDEKECFVTIYNTKT
ncbi:hypothetical protein [Asticcacaulis sp. AND118]|uniref:hypothetical protein n=1 Tax=Asticcacaulis sp. AND118 TaxID=2840468 RepID=UPI001D00126D|nr:hypothetical protein [Asticcacaulis sp. AND118]UDF03427.1 hypothetical protein LH365_13450 [Asticcacaulis sp. AND118]